MGSGNKMILYAEMTSLAEACRKRFGVTSKLSLDDMIKLITPPAFPSGTEILGRTRVSLDQSDMPLTLKAVPPANTSIISNKAILRTSKYNLFTIEKIIATY